MGERRKRKSLWDQEDETKHFSGVSEHNSWTGKDHHSRNDSGRYHEFSASGTFAEAKSGDHSGKPSWKSTEEIPVAPMHGSFINSRQDVPDGKEMGGVNMDYQNMSPGFDRVEQHKHNQDLGNGRSHSRRHMGRGRSRSQSRSRSHSRSLSRGRRRERGRGRSRSRSRSRSSSRSDGSSRGRRRSRSPIGDYRRQSYGWSDKKGAPDKSSQICRDFTAGNCRRGSQCRFLHPKNVNCGDGNLMGDNAGETRRDMTNHDQVSKHAFNKGPQSENQGDSSDPSRWQNEQFRSRSRNAVTCKDFVKGKCRWGDTCRFSHHSGYAGGFEKSTRYPSFNKDVEPQPDKNGKEICKYFAAGKCDRDNCRFSHEDPKYSSPESRQGEVAKDYGSRDKKNPWNDATRISDNARSVGHSLGNENESWGIPEWTDNSTKLIKLPSPPEGIGGYGQDIGTAESTGKENLANRQEHLILHGSQLQNQEANAKVQGQNIVQEDFSMNAQQHQQNISPALPIQQHHHGVVENKLVTSLASGVLGEVGNSRNNTQSGLFSGQNYQNGENVGLSGDSNGPELHQIAPLNLESQVQNHLKAVQMTGILETKIPQFVPNLLTNEHSSQLTNSGVAVTDQHATPMSVPSMFPNERFMNVQPQKNPDAEGYNSLDMTSFSDSSGNVPLVNATNLWFNQAGVSHEPIVPEETDTGMSEHENHTEQGNEMKVGQSSPFSTVGEEPGNTKVGHPRSPSKLNQVMLVMNSEVDKSNAAIGNERTGVQNNMESETLDRRGKVEEKSVTKDDKAMRAFKNSLIEFVKDLLKPTWKEGKMSREVHKTIVKKVVEKITSTIQADHIPKTQDKVDQYLSYSKSKIAKLVQAYVARCLKADTKS